MDNSVVDVPERSRFELKSAAGTAFVDYLRDQDGRLVLTHTEVPPEMAGQGTGSRLAKGVFDLVRDSGRTCVPRCEFLAGWVARHPDYRPVVDG